jgi:hypothetical protein
VTSSWGRAPRATTLHKHVAVQQQRDAGCEVYLVVVAVAVAGCNAHHLLNKTILVRNLLIFGTFAETENLLDDKRFRLQLSHVRDDRTSAVESHPETFVVCRRRPGRPKLGEWLARCTCRENINRAGIWELAARLTCVDHALALMLGLA